MSAEQKVLHVAEAAMGGGSESVFRDTVQALYEDRHEGYRHFVACKVTGKEPFRVDFPFAADNAKGRIGIILSQIFSTGHFRTLYRALQECRPDIIHIQSYGNLSPSVLKAIYKYKSKHNGVKVLQTVHTFEYICSHFAGYDYRQNRRCTDCAGSRYKFKIFYRGCSRAGYLHSWGKGIASLIGNYYIKRGVIDRWLSPSHFLRELMVRRLPADKVTLVRNPLHAQNTAGEQNTKTAGKPFLFVYFGRFSEEKNIECLVQAFARIYGSGRQVKLLLIGKGEEKEKLVALCETLSISEGVEFIEFLPVQELNKRLQQAHVSILPSKCFENAPMVVNESVFADLVPIVANHGGMKEMIEVAGFGLCFESDDAANLALQMEQVMDNFDHYMLDLPRAKETINGIFNVQVYLSALYENYNTATMHRERA